MNLKELRELVLETCGCDGGHMEKPEVPDQTQGKMARTDLIAIARDAEELVNMFGDDSDLPEWVESNITKAADYLNSVKKHLGGEIVRLVQKFYLLLLLDTRWDRRARKSIF